MKTKLQLPQLKANIDAINRMTRALGQPRLKNLTSTTPTAPKWNSNPKISHPFQPKHTMSCSTTENHKVKNATPNHSGALFASTEVNQKKRERWVSNSTSDRPRTCEIHGSIRHLESQHQWQQLPRRWWRKPLLDQGQHQADTQDALFITERPTR